RASKPGGVQPERVVVARHQGGRHVAGDLVERLLRRLDRRRPVAAAPAEPAQPATGLDVAYCLRDPLQRLVERARPLQADLSLRERPGWEMDVGVVEAGQEAAAAEVDHVRAR